MRDKRDSGKATRARRMEEGRQICSTRAGEREREIYHLKKLLLHLAAEEECTSIFDIFDNPHGQPHVRREEGERNLPDSSVFAQS